MIKVGSLNLSVKKGTIKKPVEKIKVTKTGFEGDAHAGNWHRQISLLGENSVEKFAKLAKRKINPGEFAENITISGLDLNKLSVLDRLKIGEVELEITQIGKKCHGDSCAIYREVGNCVMPKEGLFARVLKTGEISVGDEIEYIPYKFQIQVITLSDRAFKKEYEDISGPTITKMLNSFFENKRWHINISNTVIPDDEEKLTNLLTKAKENNVDIVITTGGTGIGPRDITPDVVMKLADKEIKGIMDYIRIKYGEKIPNALCSRSVTAVMKNTIVYTLPGSVKAVKEYTEEILKTMEHLVFMLHGLGH